MTRLFVGLVGTAALVVACSDDGVPQGDMQDDGGGSTSNVGLDTGEGDTSGLSSPDPSAGVDTSEPGDSTSATGTADDTTAGGTTLGCGLPYTGDPVVEGQIDVDGVARTFVLSVPEGYDPSVPTPLVFAWHGLGGNGNLARLYFGVEQSSAGAAIFVYPDGLAQASFGGSTGWDLLPSGGDVAYFDALLAELDTGLCIDHERLFSTGHSFGGYFSNALGCFRADVLRAIAPVAGGPPLGACQDARVAAWITHGSLDGVVPFDQGQSARDALLGRNACSDTTVEVPPEPCVTYDGCDADHPVVWCAHDLADQDGHSWPPFAADAIWTFFAGLAPSASP